MSAPLALYGVLVPALFVGTALFRSAKHAGITAQCVAFSLPLLITILGGGVLAEFLESFFRPFNDGRLAPAASLLHGYKLYYPPCEGPLLGMMYSPLAALMYIPAVLAPTPAAAVACGEALTMVYYFAPVIIAIVGESRRAGVDRATTVLILVSFGLMTLLTQALAGPAFWIHADAPALGFAGLACAWMHLRQRNDRIIDFAVPAILAVAAVLSKQVAAPMLVAVPICALFLGGRRAFLCSIVAIAGAILTGTILLLSAFDLAALLLNTIYVPGHHPWKSQPSSALVQGGWSLFESGLLPVGIMVGCTFLAPRRAQAAGNGPQASRWQVWLITAGLMVPTSILGWVKIGGAANALAYTVYFLTVVAHLRLLHVCACRPEFCARMSADAPSIPLCLAVSLALWLTPAFATRLPSLAARFPENPEQVGFQFAKQHPGEVYFPFNPLITLKSEGRAYHFSDGVWIRELAGIAPSDTSIRAFLPNRTSMIAFTGPSDQIQKYLPEFSNRITVTGLQGWQVFARRDRSAANRVAVRRRRPSDSEPRESRGRLDGDVPIYGTARSIRTSRLFLREHWRERKVRSRF
jgi:hypothetical protein